MPATSVKAGTLVSGTAAGQRSDRILQCVEARPGKKGGQGAGFIEFKFKDFLTGQMLPPTKFRPSEDIELVDVDSPVAYQFLYRDSDLLVLMDMESFDEVTLPQSLLGGQLRWLVDGMEVNVRRREGTPVVASLPEKAEYVVTEADESTKKSKDGVNHKQVTLANGETLRVPQFVKEGDTVVVNTHEGEYVTKL